MKSKFITSILASVFLLIGFLTKNTDNAHYKRIDSICAKIEKQCAKDLNLSVFGRGGSMVYNVKSIDRVFAYYESIDIEQARSNAIKCAKIFLKEINQDKKGRPFLNQYPFTPQNIKLQITSINSETKEHFAPPAIALVAIEGGHVKYYTSYHPDAQLKLIKKETFEEACALLDEGQ